MKITHKLLMGLSLAILFAGCTGTTAVPPLSQQQKRVVQEGNKYYYIPSQTFGGAVTKPWDYKNKVETSGFLNCPVGYGLVISNNEKKKFDTVANGYRAILNAQETKIYDTHPTITPKSNSKEYKKMVAELTAMYRRGSYACIRPMTNKEVKQYKAYQAQQAKINNDPRVVAARIQAQSARNVSNAQISAANNRATWDNINRQNAQMNYNTQQMLNRMNTYNVKIY